MSFSAIGEDGKIYYTDDFSNLHLSEYFCPNKNCGVKMILKNKGSDEKEHKNTSPYFSALKKSGHIEGCEYGSKSVSSRSLNTSGFILDDFFYEDNLTIGQNIAYKQDGQ